MFAVTFLESFIIPLIPDVLLAPMCACRPQRAMYLALMTTVLSTLGGLVGYVLGFLALDTMLAWIADDAWHNNYQQAKSLFDEWGAGVIIVAGFSPIPYKVFTVAAGAFAQPVIVFIIASLIGRGMRFFLVAYVAQRWGMASLAYARPWIERFGWLLALALVLAIAAFYWY